MQSQFQGSGVELELDAETMASTLEVDGGPVSRRIEAPDSRLSTSEDGAARRPPAAREEASVSDSREEGKTGKARTGGTAGESKSGARSELATRAGELANFGTCTSPLRAPAYSVRVWRRRSELGREIVRLRADLQRQEAEAEEALARVGRAVRRPAAAEVDLAPLVDGIARAEAEAREREEAVAAADASSASISSNADDRIAQARGAILPLESEGEQTAAQLKVKQDGLRRARAQLKRTEIEIRNLRDLANARDTEALGQLDAAKKAALVAQAAELRARIPAEEAQRAAQQAALDEAAGPVAQLEQALARQRKRLAEAQAAISRLEAGRHKEITALDRARHDRLRVLESAKESVRSRLAELARAAVDRNIADEVAAPLIPEARTAASIAEATRRELELYTAALGAFDKDRLSQGALILGGAALLLFVLIFFLASR